MNNKYTISNIYKYIGLTKADGLVWISYNGEFLNEPPPSEKFSDLDKKKEKKEKEEKEKKSKK